MVTCLFPGSVRGMDFRLTERTIGQRETQWYSAPKNRDLWLVAFMQYRELASSSLGSGLGPYSAESRIESLVVAGKEWRSQLLLRAGWL